MLYPFDAVSDPMRNLQGNVDPIITTLVAGQPNRIKTPSSFILRNITVPNWFFQWNKFGFERFQEYDTERAMRAEIRTSEYATSYETGRLRRFTHATKRDVDELANAAPGLRVRELQTILAREIVNRDIERIVKNLLTTVTNYPVSHRLALAGGAEWNSAGGDSRANIRAMASAIAADTGVSYSDVSVFLTEDSLNAALADPVFLTARMNYDTDTPNTDALVRYWGIKEIFTANPLSVSSTGVVTSMYGDVAILFVNSIGSDWDTTFGEYDFAVNFKWNKGTALSAFYEDKNTCWWFPYQDYASPQIINSSLGAIITNTKV